jgi:hypothetical protein
MAARRLPLLALALLLGCGSDPAPKGSFAISIQPIEVGADGVAFALVEVTGTSVGTVKIRSNRGSFEGMGPTVFFNRAPFTTMLVTCDSRADTGCAGWALVDASDESLAAAKAQVHFLQLP